MPPDRELETPDTREPSPDYTWTDDEGRPLGGWVQIDAEEKNDGG